MYNESILLYLSFYSSVWIFSVFVLSFFIVFVFCVWCILFIFCRRIIICILIWLSCYCISFIVVVRCRVFCRWLYFWINIFIVYCFSLICWVSVMFVSMFDVRISVWFVCGSVKYFILFYRYYIWIYRCVVIFRWFCWGCCFFVSLWWLFIF